MDAQDNIFFVAASACCIRAGGIKGLKKHRYSNRSQKPRLHPQKTILFVAASACCIRAGGIKGLKSAACQGDAAWP
jgi:hypothetical protein